MTPNNTTSPSTWARVELVRSTVLVGRITEEQKVGTPMLRIDTPATAHQDGSTVWVTPQAIYSITLLSQAEAEDYLAPYAPNAAAFDIAVVRANSTSADVTKVQVNETMPDAGVPTEIPFAHWEDEDDDSDDWYYLSGYSEDNDPDPADDEDK